MKASPKSTMVMSATPSGRILITAIHVETWGIPDSDVLRAGRASSDATATEIVPMTDEAFASFVSRHPGRPVYPSLATYPKPRGD